MKRRQFNVPISDVARISRQIVNLGSPVTVDQSHFRFYNDDGAINAATAIAAEDADISGFSLNTNFRLRMLMNVSLTGTDRASGAIQLQARLRANSFTSEWFSVNSTSPCVRPSASSNVLDGAACTQILTDTRTFFVDAKYDEVDGAAATTTLVADTAYECEFCLQAKMGHLANGDIVDFRLIQGGTVLDTYTQTPSFTVVANTVVFTPTGVVGLNDWLDQTELAAATHAQVDEGVPGNADTDYMTRLDNVETNDTEIVHSLTASGTANMSSGADSWGIRCVAKKIGAGTPDAFALAVYETATLRAGPFDHAAALTTSYKLFIDTFDPSAITAPANLRTGTTGSSNAGADGDPTVTVLDIVGQKAVMLDMLPLLGVS